MSSLIQRYSSLIKQKAFYIEVATGLLLIAGSFAMNYFANSYTGGSHTAVVSDIILDNVPVVNVEYIFLEGAITLMGVVILIGLYKPARIPYMLKVAALFIAVRSFFIILTHLAPPLNHSTLNASGFLENLVSGSGDDLFFSGHTGFPFLGALVFWDQKVIRWFFLVYTAFFAAAVLLGHLHYSIDVFSAFFISYGISHIAMKAFKKDKQNFDNA